MAKPGDLKALEAIYRDIPKMTCKGLCGWDDKTQDGCCGPLTLPVIERRRILQASGSVPKADAKTYLCNKYINGKCSVYPIRPLICRLWGTVRSMACPHGCEPEQWLSARESVILIERLRAIGGPEIADPVSVEAIRQDPGARILPSRFLADLLEGR